MVWFGSPLTRTAENSERETQEASAAPFLRSADDAGDLAIPTPRTVILKRRDDFYRCIIIHVRPSPFAFAAPGGKVIGVPLRAEEKKLPKVEQPVSYTHLTLPTKA